ncbi:hypothetical protein CARUB_v10003831mg [Capsella rubella]|uniref:Protein kinase domain-containing protein n=1 Tax=Capsella rubella TaxID=81985 RepID=R0FM48_9BRAS|nr:hypothetical protein CARUB_v10003831mg [Capsella rubella]
MGNIVKPFKQQPSSFAYQPLTVPLISVEAKNENLWVFRFADLKKATKKFRQDRIIECEDGSVRKFYKGYIDETTFSPSRTGTGITVSVMEYDSSCSIHDWMETVRSLEHISHPNLVKLLGYCCEDNKPLLLVFEYSHRVSLDRHIFGEEDALPWEIRVKIAIGTARGLVFLHSIKNRPLNRELRMHNIMLDEVQYNVKLLYLESDEQYRLVDEGQVAGIFRCPPPEIWSGNLGMESDVYIFGVILLELLTGSTHSNIIKYKQRLGVCRLCSTSTLPHNYKIADIIDPRLGNYYSVDAAIQMGTLINRCTEKDTKKRPLMKQVLDSLNDIAEIKD